MASSTKPLLSAVGALLDTIILSCRRAGQTRDEKLTLADLRTQADVGVAGGRTINGGTQGVDGLTLQGTSNATPGPVVLTGSLVGFGGSTASFPGLKRSGQALQIKLADDSGPSWIEAAFLRCPPGSSPTVAVGRGAGTKNLGLALSGNLGVAWTSGGNSESGFDVEIDRVAPGVIKITDASSGLGWQQWAGESYLSADLTNATATLASTTLSISVTSGRKYMFKAILYVSDSVAAEGVQVDFGGGTAAATNFRAHVTGFDSALTVNTQVTSLTGVASAGTFSGSGMIEIHGSFEPSSSGTFIPRFAQNTHAVGTLTLFRGSHIQMWDSP